MNKTNEKGDIVNDGKRRLSKTYGSHEVGRQVGRSSSHHERQQQVGVETASHDSLVSEHFCCTYVAS